HRLGSERTSAALHNALETLIFFLQLFLGVINFFFRVRYLRDSRCRFAYLTCAVFRCQPYAYVARPD
ncbi:MAG: hypothetical protein K6U74_07170, partial [Firmicutes bacterium]|nr:hypothetical protein [Bacillota bacterium]